MSAACCREAIVPVSSVKSLAVKHMICFMHVNPRLRRGLALLSTSVVLK
jgi:hypothetical protein